MMKNHEKDSKESPLMGKRRPARKAHISQVTVPPTENHHLTERSNVSLLGISKLSAIILFSSICVA